MRYQLVMSLCASLGFDLARRLSGEASLRGAMRVVLDAVLDVPGIDAGGVYLFDARAQTLDLVESRGLSPDFVARVSHYPAGDPHVTVPRAGQPVFDWHDRLANAHAEVRAEGVRSLGIVPVMHGGELVAVLNAASHTLPRLDETTQAALVSLAALVGGAIARVATEEALRASEARLQLALEATGQEPWFLDLENARIDLGPVWSSRLPAAPARTGDPAQDRHNLLARLVHPADRELLMSRVVALRQNGGVLDSGHRVLCADGTTRWIRIVGRVTERSQDGSPRTFIGTTTDVTERRALQAKALQADRLGALGRLAAGIAHEINNPLAYIVANLDFAVGHLRSTQGPEMQEVATALAEARAGAAAVREIARDLRTLARADDDADSSADVDAALRQALNLARNQVRQRARIETEIGALPPVDGSGARLSQVFLNLLINAAQALPEGAADVHVVSVTARTDAAGRARVEVRDTGPGIAPDLLPRIFDPFFTTKPPGEGTGLGLSICHAIVTSLGGELEVETTLGKGSCFRVLLPPGRPRPARALPAPVGAVRRQRVLVIDDEPFVANAVRRLLEEHSVVIASGADVALAQLETDQTWDVILCDIVMPGLDGPALHARIRQRWPHLLPRLAMMTGGAFTDRAREFLERETPVLLNKPFDAEALRGLLARLPGTDK